MNKTHAVFTAFVFLGLMGAGCNQSQTPVQPPIPVAPVVVPVEPEPVVTEPEPTPVPVAQPVAEEKKPAPTPAPTPKPAPVPVPEPEPTPTPAPAPVARSFDIEAHQWDFEPSTIRVNQGDEVTLRVTSMDVEHGIAISAYGINETLPPFKTVTIKFTADKKGTFTFFCNVFCGAGHGSMKGSLIVE